MINILITGFEPFDGMDVNSSWETAVRVGQQPPKGANVEAAQLPVSFHRCTGIIEDLLKDRKPDVLIMLGQRSRGQSIDIERIAINLMDSEKTDNDGYRPQEMQISPSGEAAYFSTLPVKKLRDSLLDKGIPAKVSNSAGLYVCNCSYYSALKAIKANQLDTECVFVHLPKISEIFSVKMLSEAVLTIIESIFSLNLLELE